MNLGRGVNGTTQGLGSSPSCSWLVMFTPFRENAPQLVVFPPSYELFMICKLWFNVGHGQCLEPFAPWVLLFRCAFLVA